MYLRAELYVSGYEFAPEERQKQYRDLVETFEVAKFVDPETPSATVGFTVGYWRKANQIHSWFVGNVQNGVDECQPSYVSRDQLTTLRALCARVIAACKKQDGEVIVGYKLDETGEQVALKEPGSVIANPAVAMEHLPTQEGFFFGGVEYDEYYLEDLKHTIATIDRALELPEAWEFEYQSSW